MSTPTDRAKRDYFWDLFRRKYRIFPQDNASKVNLIQHLRIKMGYRLSQRTTSTDKSTLQYVKKSDFFPESKKDVRGIPNRKFRKWRPEEESLLNELRKSYKGYEVYWQYNRKASAYRSLPSVERKVHRLKYPEKKK